MLKKMGMIGVGVTAGLLAAAPFASATECPDGGHGHDGHGFNANCKFTGGNADAASEISGDSLANAVAQAPIAGNNVGNIADCSSFLNDNLNGNFSGNNVALLGSNLEPTNVVKSQKLESNKVDSAKSKFESKKADVAKPADAKKSATQKVNTYKLNGKSASPSSMMSF